MSSGDYVCTNPDHIHLQEENERLEAEMKELQEELEEKNSLFMPPMGRQQSNAQEADHHLKSVIQELQNTIDGLEMQNSAAELSETEVVSLRQRCTDLVSKIHELQNTIDGLEQQTLAAEDSTRETIRLRSRLAEREEVERDLRSKIEQFEGKLENLRHYKEGTRSREQIESLMSKIEELQNTIDGLEQQNLAAEAFSIETSELRSRILQMNRQISQFSEVAGGSIGRRRSFIGVIDYRMELEKQYEREKVYKQKIIELQNTIDGLDLQAQGAELVVLSAQTTHAKLQERNSVIGELQNIIGGLELQSLAVEETTKESETLRRELSQRRNTEFNLNNKIVELENAIDGLELQTRGAEEGVKEVDALQIRITEMEDMMTKEHPEKEYLFELQSEMNDLRNAMRFLKNENRELVEEIDDLRARSDDSSDQMNQTDIHDLLSRINILEVRQKERQLDWGMKEKLGREVIETYQKQVRKLEDANEAHAKTVEHLQEQLNHLRGGLGEGGGVHVNVRPIDDNQSDGGSSHLSVGVEVSHYRRESAYLRDECEALMEEMDELKAQMETPEKWEPPAMILPQSQGIIRPTMTDAELKNIKSQIQLELHNIRAHTAMPGQMRVESLRAAPTLEDPSTFLDENNLPPDHPDYDDGIDGVAAIGMDGFDDLLISPSLEKSVKFAPGGEGPHGGRGLPPAVRSNTRTSWGQLELDKLKRDMVLEMNTMVKREMRDMLEEQDRLRWSDNQPAMGSRVTEEAAVLDAASVLVSNDTGIVTALRDEVNKLREKLRVADLEMDRIKEGQQQFSHEYADSLSASRTTHQNLRSDLTAKSEENDRLVKRHNDLEDDLHQMEAKMRQTHDKMREMEESIQTVVASKLRLIQTTSEEMESLRSVIKRIAKMIKTR